MKIYSVEINSNSYTVHKFPQVFSTEEDAQDFIKRYISSPDRITRIDLARIKCSEIDDQQLLFLLFKNAIFNDIDFRKAIDENSKITYIPVEIDKNE